MVAQYSLFWSEPEQRYHLMADEELVGRLSDDTDFAMRTMRAYNESLELLRLRERLRPLAIMSREIMAFLESEK